MESADFHLAPVLDLKGFNRQGDPAIVEVKCGWAQHAAKATTQMQPPFDNLNCNERNLAFLQLGMQVCCLRTTGCALQTKNAWLATVMQTPDDFKVVILELKEDLLTVASSMIEQHAARSQFINDM